jgi:hypothetical protein
LPEADPSILNAPKSAGRSTAAPAGPVRPRPTPPAAATAAESGPGTAAATETSPATDTAPAAPAAAALPSKTDHSSPKATLKAVFAGVETGDLAAIKACFVTPANDEQKDLLENGLDTDVISLTTFFNAMKAKFPGAPAKGGSVVDLMTLDSTIEEINGEKAIVKSAKESPDQPPINLVKVGDEWKFPIAQDAAGGLLHKKSETEQAASKELEGAVAGVVSDLNAGKFASDDDAMAAFLQKMKAINEKYPQRVPGPTTAPAAGG